MGERKEEQQVPVKEEKKVEKLTYEQLEGVAKQMSAQIDYLAKENQQLKTALQQAQLSNMYTELNFRFKVLEYANFFKPSFVEDVVKYIEDIMTIEADTNQKEE